MEGPPQIFHSRRHAMAACAVGRGVGTEVGLSMVLRARALVGPRSFLGVIKSRRAAVR